MTGRPMPVAVGCLVLAARGVGVAAILLVLALATKLALVGTLNVARWWP